MKAMQSIFILTDIDIHPAVKLGENDLIRLIGGLIFLK
jgi:hypothetical protein